MGEDQTEAMKEIMRDQTDRSKGRADEIAAAAPVQPCLEFRARRGAASRRRLQCTLTLRRRSLTTANSHPFL
jgi:hypothetical protein